MVDCNSSVLGLTTPDLGLYLCGLLLQLHCRMLAGAVMKVYPYDEKRLGGRLIYCVGLLGKGYVLAWASLEMVALVVMMGTVLMMDRVKMIAVVATTMKE